MRLLGCVRLESKDARSVHFQQPAQPTFQTWATLQQGAWQSANRVSLEVLARQRFGLGREEDLLAAKRPRGQPTKDSNPRRSQRDSGHTVHRGRRHLKRAGEIAVEIEPG